MQNTERMRVLKNTFDLKKKNMLSLINIIRDKGSVSKPDIVKLSNLSSVTVHNFIKELVKSGICVECGMSASSGGRRATLYSMRGSLGSIIAVNITQNGLFTNIYDTNMKNIYSSFIACDMSYSPSVLELILDEIDTAIKSGGNTKILGISLIMPGLVDPDEGRIIHLPQIRNWNDVQLLKAVREHTKLTTYVDNNANACCLLACLRGIIEKDANAVYLMATEGTGLGILVNGRLFYGAHYAAGEIGHIDTGSSAERLECSCGSTGCLETLTSQNGIIRRVEQILSRRGISNANLNIGYIVKKAASDEEIYKVLEQAAVNLHKAIEIIIKILDPEYIVINTGWLDKFQDLYNIVVGTSEAVGKVKILQDNNPETLNMAPCAMVLEDLYDYESENCITALF